MCDACDRVLNRRTLLRGVMIGGTALAVSGAGLLSPGRAIAGTGDGSEFEFADVDEDRRSGGSAAPSAGSGASASGGAASSGSASSGSTSTGAAASGGSPAPGARPTGKAGTRQIAAPNTNGLQAPPISSRAMWGADESIRLDDRAYAPVRKLIVHHSASENNPKNPVDVVRFIQRYHTTGRGFSDSGYNYLIDHKGAIYEGRAARVYKSGEAITNEDANGWGVVGAHAKGNNAGSCGICLIGNFDLGSPTDAALSSLVWLLAYKASRYRIDATASDEYIDLYGNHRVYPNIAGHRQVGSTVCPGKRLFGLLPTIRDEVARRAGHWDAVTVDVPGVVRWEVGSLRSAGSSSGSSTTTGASGSSNAAAGSTGSGSPASGSAGAGSAGTGTKMVGVRVVSSVGKVYTAGKGQAHGNPSSKGSTNVVAMANAASGDGYWTLDASGAVNAFGGVGHFGDAAGKGVAADIAIAANGKGYWVLMADGGIYPFGAAGYASSPKKAGLGGTAKRIVARPQGDGYWVLMGDGTVRAFGSAPKFGAPSGSGNPVDIEPTASGKGYWVLTDSGVVAPFGDAVDKGDLKRSKVKWSKQATHLVRTGSGNGYMIVNSEGSMLAFGDAPTYTSFGGSGMKATGATASFG